MINPLPHLHSGEIRRRRGAVRLRRASAGSLLTCALIAAVAGPALGSSSRPSGNVNIVAYSVPAPAFAAQIRLFNKTSQGKAVTFTQSYGPSGSQAKAVIAGQPADIVNFSSATDIETLVAKGLVPSNWNANSATKGMVTDSVVVFVVPKGNPDHIESWSDLLKAGVRVFTPNPFSSGSARWNLMAAYGAALKKGDSTTEAQNFVKQLLQKTVVQSASAATELQAFLADDGANKGDVLLDYESDTIQAIRAGQSISYVVPKQTILIENPLAVTTNAKNPTAATAFYNYLFSTAGQQEWAKLGYRPVLPAVAAATRKDFPHPAQLFTIVSLGGWDQVNSKFFSTSSSSPGVITEIESSLGQTT